MVNVESVCQQCSEERQRSLFESKAESSGCTQLFELAFGYNTDGLGCILTIFEYQFKRWMSAQIRQLDSPLVSLADVDEIFQIASIKIISYAKKYRKPPVPQEEWAKDKPLTFYLAWSKMLIIRCVGEFRRKEDKHSHNLPWDDQEYPIIPAPIDPIHDLTNRLYVQELLQQCVKSEAEKIIAERVFLGREKQQDVINDIDNLELFPKGVISAHRVTERLMRCLRRRVSGDGEKGGGSASLEFRLDDEETEGQKTMKVFPPCQVDEGVLLDYINGHLDAETCAIIERSPACVEATKALRNTLATLQPTLRDMFCPTPEVLEAYQHGQLTENYEAVKRHVDRCHFCQEELAIIQLTDQVVDWGDEEAPALETGPGFLGKLKGMVYTVIEALPVMPTLQPVPLLGEVFVYQTPRLTITLDLEANRAESEELSWTLAGSVRTVAGELFDSFEKIELTDQTDDRVAPIAATIESPGVFVFTDLAAGYYRLSIFTATEEIYIPAVDIGYDEERSL